MINQLLSRRDEMIVQFVLLSGGEITRFDCGGLVIRVRIHHILVDGLSAASFVSAWATASREGLRKSIVPTFGLNSFFPENENDLKNLKAKTLEESRLSSYFCNERNRK